MVFALFWKSTISYFFFSFNIAVYTQEICGKKQNKKKEHVTGESLGRRSEKYQDWQKESKKQAKQILEGG